jgi:hypothetical protein
LTFLDASEGFVRGLFGLVVWELVVTSRFEVSAMADTKVALPDIACRFLFCKDESHGDGEPLSFATLCSLALTDLAFRELGTLSVFLRLLFGLTCHWN